MVMERPQVGEKEEGQGGANLKGGEQHTWERSDERTLHLRRTGSGAEAALEAPNDVARHGHRSSRLDEGRVLAEARIALVREVGQGLELHERRGRNRRGRHTRPARGRRAEAGPLVLRRVQHHRRAEVFGAAAVRVVVRDRPSADEVEARFAHRAAPRARAGPRRCAYTLEVARVQPPAMLQRPEEAVRGAAVKVLLQPCEVCRAEPRRVHERKPRLARGRRRW